MPVKAVSPAKRTPSSVKMKAADVGMTFVDDENKENCFLDSFDEECRKAFRR